jgi:hypothetical protein
MKVEYNRNLELKSKTKPEHFPEEYNNKDFNFYPLK